MDDKFKNLIGKKVIAIYLNDDYLQFHTEKDVVTYLVDGDCCSRSYLHDFLGVQTLLKNGPVLSVDGIPLKEDGNTEDEYNELLCYGYRIITEHPQYGEMSSVFSFRNLSNGYYGGSIGEVDRTENGANLNRIEEDWIND